MTDQSAVPEHIKAPAYSTTFDLAGIGDANSP
jgi:hypothetical protein